MSEFDKIEKLMEDPTIIFSNESDKNIFDCVNLLESLKSIVDPLIESSDNCVLDEIYVDGLDATQVWGQVKLVFDGFEKDIWSDIGKFKAEGQYDDEAFDSEIDEDEDVDEEDEDEEDDEEQEAENEQDEEEKEEGEEEEVEEEEEESELNESDSEEKEETTVSSSKDYGLNDEFFNLDEYKRQVLQLEDNDNDNDDGEEIDYFGDMSDEAEDDEEMYTYNDFFDPKGSNEKSNIKHKKSNKKKDKSTTEFAEEDYDEAYDLAQADIFGDEVDEGSDDSDEEGEEGKNLREENLSTFEKQQRELAKQIAELEAESIAEKKWTMKGEVSGKQRESDTLLEEDLEFDRTAKPVPVITQEVTESIEDIIRRRIINQEFDEIPKRIISELNNFRSSKKVQVSEEKSSKSLAELYEDEYNGKTGGNEEVSEALKAAHDEINEMFKDVTYQLDSLYSSHFVPKPKEKLLDVRIETSTIAMEDAQPLTMSSSNSLAPQEIYKIGNTKVGKDEVILRSGVVMAKAELERDDKQRLHRAKKRKQHLASKDESIKKKKVESNQL